MLCIYYFKNKSVRISAYSYVIYVNNKNTCVYVYLQYFINFSFSTYYAVGFVLLFNRLITYVITGKVIM